MLYQFDPKNGLAFKRVFFGHKRPCKSLLNSLLPLDESQQIAEIEYQPEELFPKIKSLYNPIINVRCKDVTGRQFIAKIYFYWTKFAMRPQIQLNDSKAYVIPLDKADKYELLPPVYALSFVNDIFDESPEMRNEYYHHYKTVNTQDTQQQVKGLEFVFIELPKFVPQNRAEKKLHELWLRYLTEIDESTREVSPELLENSDISEAIKYVEIGAYTEDQLSSYDKVRDAIMTERSRMSDADRAGEERGIKKGIKEGEKKGEKKGRKDERKKIALAALKKGISLEDVSEMTGLSINELLKLNK
jgi:predicted transposase/invertase (TIGR01784 family)